MLKVIIFITCSKLSSYYIINNQYVAYFCTNSWHMKTILKDSDFEKHGFVKSGSGKGSVVTYRKHFEGLTYYLGYTYWDYLVMSFRQFDNESEREKFFDPNRGYFPNVPDYRKEFGLRILESSDLDFLLIRNDHYQQCCNGKPNKPFPDKEYFDETEIKNDCQVHENKYPK